MNQDDPNERARPQGAERNNSADHELNRQLLLFQQTEALTRSGSWQYDLTNHQFSASAGFYRLLGLPPHHTLQPQSLLEFIVAEDRALARQMLENVLQKQEPFVELLRVTVHQQVQTLQIEAAFMNQGENRLLVGVCRNLQESVERNQLNEPSSTLMQRSRLLRRASHFLRSCFGVIDSVAFLLDLEGDSAQERHQLLEMLTRNMKAVRHLVTQLGDLARLEAQQETVSLTEFNVSPRLQTILDAYQAWASRRRIALNGQGPFELWIRSDASHLERIVQTMIRMAILQGKSVYVEWERTSDEQWQVLVTASPKEGIVGVHPGSEIRLEADEEMPGSYPAFEWEGEALQWSIAKGLVQLLGGTVTVTPSPDGKSIFRLQLPVNG